MPSPVRAVRLLPALLSVSVAALLFASSAFAHGTDGTDERVLKTVAAGTPLEAQLLTHADSHEQLFGPEARQALAQYAFAPRAVALSSSVDHLAETWCGVIRSTDNRTDQVDTTSPVIKVIYAYPSDRPNRFNQNFADLIQRKVKQVSELVADASANTKTLRWDLGTNCGPQYVDIQVVALPRTAAYYTDQANGFSRITADVHAATPDLAKTGQKRNYAIYADHTTGIGYGGQGSIYNYPNKDGYWHQQGQLDAVVYSWGYYNAAAQNFSDEGYHNVTLLHEITHNLGGVQNNAPHSSGASHCWDDWDLECYDDGGSQMPSVQNGTRMRYLCDPAQGYADLIWDCGQDDYFNPSPAPGSYLANNWNLYDSVFLCQLDSCGVSNDAPEANLTASTDYPGVGETVTFDASGSVDDHGITSYEWDLDGNGSFETSGAAVQAKTFAWAGTYTIRVRVSDAQGATDEATAQVQVVVANRAPQAVLMPAQTSVRQGESVVFSAILSGDPDFDPITYAWDLDGDGSFETAAGIERTKTFPHTGSFVVRLKVTDLFGATATAQSTVTVTPGYNHDGGGDDGDGDSDSTPTLLEITSAPRQARSQAFKRGVLAGITIDHADKVAVTAHVSARDARRAKLKGKRVKGRVTVGRTTVKLNAHHARAVRVQLSAKARRAFRRRDMTVRLTASDSAHRLTDSTAVKLVKHVSVRTRAARR